MDPAVLAALPPSMQLDLLVQVNLLSDYVVYYSLCNPFQLGLDVLCLIDFCFVDEGKIDGRKQTKVSKSKKGSLEKFSLSTCNDIWEIS